MAVHETLVSQEIRQRLNVVARLLVDFVDSFPTDTLLVSALVHLRQIICDTSLHWNTQTLYSYAHTGRNDLEGDDVTT